MTHRVTRGLSRPAQAARPGPTARPPSAADTGTVRIGPVSAIPGLLAEFDVAPRRALRRVGLEPTVFSDPDTRIPFTTLGRLLDVSVELSSCRYFGLLVGERFTLRTLGALGDSMQNCATVGQALRELHINLHRYDRGAVPVLLDVDSTCTLLGYSIRQHDTPGAAQIHDASTAISYRMLQELCGPAWTPLYVQLSHGQPRKAQPYRRLFRTRVMFNAEISGVAFSRNWMSAPIRGADPLLHRLTSEAVRHTSIGNDTTFAERVRHVVHAMLPGGSFATADIARLFGIHQRTVRKRLAADGASLQRIVAESRFEVARQLLAHTDLPLSEIAASLHFADPAVFSRAFKGWAGINPRDWRADLRRRLAGCVQPDQSLGAGGAPTEMTLSTGKPS
jgi:AraC-like DNA-binding protein